MMFSSFRVIKLTMSSRVSLVSSPARVVAFYLIIIDLDSDLILVASLLVSVMLFMSPVHHCIVSVVSTMV